MIRSVIVGSLKYNVCAMPVSLLDNKSVIFKSHEGKVYGYFQELSIFSKVFANFN